MSPSKHLGLPHEREETIMKKLIALTLCLILTLTVFAGCGQKNESDLAYIQDKGTMVVGITVYRPMDYQDENGEWIGFDAEFAKLVAKELGVEAEFVIIDWTKKFTDLAIKEIDVIWNGMTITDDVKNNTSYTNPYVINAQVVVTKADVAANYKNADSIKDISIAVENSSAGMEALEDVGITDYTALLDQAAALMEVASGTSDACVIDITMANALTGAGKQYSDLAIAFELTSEYYGIAFRKGSDVTEKVNDLMAKWMNDGTLDALAAKYNVTLVK